MKRWTLDSVLVTVFCGALTFFLSFTWSIAANAQTVEGNQQQMGGQSPSLAFCQERFYEEDDGVLRCNWAVNFNFACFVSYPSNKVVQAGSLLSQPEVVGECDNGERIIKILHY